MIYNSWGGEGWNVDTTMNWEPRLSVQLLFHHNRPKLLLLGAAVVVPPTWDKKVTGSILCYVYMFWCPWARHLISNCSLGTYIAAHCSITCDGSNAEDKSHRYMRAYTEDTFITVDKAQICGSISCCIIQIELFYLRDTNPQTTGSILLFYAEMRHPLWP